MTHYTIQIDNRNYVSWTVFNATTLEPVTLEHFNPVEHKLFNNDVFTYNKGIVQIIHSSIRDNKYIPAVLILADNKTYGRQYKLEPGQTYTMKRAEFSGGKLLYKCIPDDNRIPAFLVPYEIKQMGFSKVFNNLYVTISFNQWDDKHPRGTLTQNIGSVDVLDNFYEYQLYCKNLNASIQKFNKETNNFIKENIQDTDSFITSICNKYPQIEDRTTWKTFTIDPANSLDYDDGFSIKSLNNNQTLLSIYIANVSIWMESLNLWSVFSQRISTIYLPSSKRPMLPTILSDCLCSLQQNMRRFAFVMDITIDEYGNIISVKYTNAVIRIFKNFEYEENYLLTDDDYTFLQETTKNLSLKYKYIENISDSHDVVCYLMILMNYHCAKDLYKYHNGIFRTTINNKNSESLEHVPDDVIKFIKVYNSSSAKYININTIPECELDKDGDKKTRHDILQMDAYIHITSPIRRIVDLLNMIKFQQNHSLIMFSSDAEEFYNKWVFEIEYINETMKNIRKVQNECSLLNMCVNNPDVLDNIYDGFCLEKTSTKEDGLNVFMVYLPALKLTSKIKIKEDLENYEKRKYKLYVFQDEEKIKRKIRINLI